MAFDEDDAPEGYIAIRTDDGFSRCAHCVPVEHDDFGCDDLLCRASERDDGCNVYFIRKIDKALRKYPPAFRELLK